MSIPCMHILRGSSDFSEMGSVLEILGALGFPEFSSVCSEEMMN